MKQILSGLEANWLLLLIFVWASMPFVILSAARLPSAFSRLLIRYRLNGRSWELLSVERRTAVASLLALRRDEEIVFALIGLSLSNAEREAVVECVQKYPVSIKSLKRAWPYMRLTGSELTVHFRWYDYIAGPIGFAALLGDVAFGTMFFIESLGSIFGESLLAPLLGMTLAYTVAFFVWQQLGSLEAAIDLKRRFKRVKRR